MHGVYPMHSCEGIFQPLARSRGKLTQQIKRFQAAPLLRARRRTLVTLRVSPLFFAALTGVSGAQLGRVLANTDWRTAFCWARPSSRSTCLSAEDTWPALPAGAAAIAMLYGEACRAERDHASEGQ